MRVHLGSAHSTSSAPSFHADDDVDGEATCAERLVAERTRDDLDERKFELGQRLKKSVFSGH